MKQAGLILLLALTGIAALADTTFPPEDWQDKADPLASPAAVPGGTIRLFAGQFPQSLNYYLDNNVLSADIFGSMYESLLTTDPLTAEYQPGIAKRWTLSDDKKVFTFEIDERARWSDGKPITAADVAWTFNAIMNPTNMTGVHKVSLQTFEEPRVLSERVIQFTAKEVHWRNLGAAGGFAIMPKHTFSKQDFNKINFEFLVISGPYQVAEMKEGVQIKLGRRDDWWARSQKRFQHVANFDTITYRFFAERENAYEAFKKGQVDVYPVYTSRIWVNETKGDKFDKNWLVKQKVKNKKPIGFQGFAMNMRHPPFDDLKVRQAMAHLLDREKMNSTLMYNQYFLHKSYYEDLYSADTPCTNPPLLFDKDKARTLLKEAGWQANPETGILEKDGHPFTVKFLTRDPSSDKFLTIYNEDLKDVGIDMSIDRKDWASWSKDMDDFNFDITWAAWGAGLYKDPEGMWASSEAERTSGNNITGFKSERVDEIIEQQKTIFDVQQRHALCREIDGIIAQQTPYALLWNIDYVRLLYWNKFGTPATVLSKYGDERSITWYWWYDEDSAIELEEAMENDEHLPRKTDEVDFDATFVIKE